jgi:hypothetical protein
MFRDEDSLKIKAHIFFFSHNLSRVHFIEDLTVEKFRE